MEDTDVLDAALHLARSETLRRNSSGVGGVEKQLLNNEKLVAEIFQTRDNLHKQLLDETKHVHNEICQNMSQLGHKDVNFENNSVATRHASSSVYKLSKSKLAFLPKVNLETSAENLGSADK
jgi:hypothetical protein